MSAPTSHDPVAVNTRDDRCWVRRGWTPAGHGLYALEGSPQDAEQTLYLIGDLAEFGLRSMTHSAFPVPSRPKPDTYPPAIPWAQLMDHEDLTEFLDELAASAITHASSETALAEVEATCGRWRLIAEAQHGHNTAPGPDAMTRTVAPTQVFGEDDEFHLHHTYRVPRDLPGLGGAE
ncbi:hypothetical protein OG342_05210 [Streptomyces bobili]|uniref:hypothetical protein n=1 Tax=Streptomyces bobili TaxID=67280 RepID=UPI00225BD465|nr:hypothetical protein [Streptomyces bobili]MCX5522267.1 hypothetical protein [Streptomyces bobili]